jgi:hypothetical protein
VSYFLKQKKPDPRLAFGAPRRAAHLILGIYQQGRALWIQVVTLLLLPIPYLTLLRFTGSTDPKSIRINHNLTLGLPIQLQPARVLCCLKAWKYLRQSPMLGGLSILSRWPLGNYNKRSTRPSRNVTKAMRSSKVYTTRSSSVRIRRKRRSWRTI